MHWEHAAQRAAIRAVGSNHARLRVPRKRQLLLQLEDQVFQLRSLPLQVFVSLLQKLLRFTSILQHSQIVPYTSAQLRQLVLEWPVLVSSNAGGELKSALQLGRSCRRCLQCQLQLVLLCQHCRCGGSAGSANRVQLALQLFQRLSVALFGSLVRALFLAQTVLQRGKVRVQLLLTYGGGMRSRHVGSMRSCLLGHPLSLLQQRFQMRGLLPPHVHLLAGHAKLGCPLLALILGGWHRPVRLEPSYAAATACVTSTTACGTTSTTAANNASTSCSVANLDSTACAGPSTCCSRHTYNAAARRACCSDSCTAPRCAAHHPNCPASLPGASSADWREGLALKDGHQLHKSVHARNLLRFGQVHGCTTRNQQVRQLRVSVLAGAQQGRLAIVCTCLQLGAIVKQQLRDCN